MEVIMKTLISFLAVAMLLFAGCAEDYTFDERFDSFGPEKTWKRAAVPIPFEGIFCAVPDEESEPGSITLPNGNVIDYCTRMIISGNATHLGKVDSETSYYEVDNTVFGVDVFDDGPHPYLRQSGTGKMTAANGDSFEFTWWAKISLTDRNWKGDFTLIPGSGKGKFDGSSGSFESIGQADPVEHRNCWTSEGYIQYY